MTTSPTRTTALALLTALAVLLTLVATLVMTPPPGTAQAASPAEADVSPTVATDSLWIAGTAAGGLNESYVGACPSPLTDVAFDSCFLNGPQTRWNRGDAGPFSINAMATDGQRVYVAGQGSRALSCPISGMGTNCTQLTGGPMDSSEILSLAATPGHVWLGRNDGKIYRCPTTGTDWNADVRLCAVIDDAGQRAVSSLLLANGRLYAGLKSYGVEEKKQGLLWSCDPMTGNSCSTLDTYGNTTANTLAVGGGYLWAGLDNGIIWRCDPVKSNACDNWEDAGSRHITSVSYGGGILYAVARRGEPDSRHEGQGVVWSCSVAVANRCSTLFSTDVDINFGLRPPVAAGPGNIQGDSNVFWAGEPHSGTRSDVSDTPTTSAVYKSRLGYSAGDSARKYLGTEGETLALLDAVRLLTYLPADGPVGVGGIQVKATGIHRVANLCTRRARLPLRLTASGPSGPTVRRVVNLCRAHRAGGTTLITPITTLLDPGPYTVTARTTDVTTRRKVTVTKNATTRTTVRLGARGRG